MLHSFPAMGRRPGNYRKLLPDPTPKLLQNTPLSGGKGAACPSKELLSALVVSAPVGECCPLVGVPPSATTGDVIVSQQNVNLHCRSWYRYKRQSAVKMTHLLGITTIVAYTVWGFSFLLPLPSTEFFLDLLCQFTAPSVLVKKVLVGFALCGSGLKLNILQTPDIHYISLN